MNINRFIEWLKVDKYANKRIYTNCYNVESQTSVGAGRLSSDFNFLVRSKAAFRAASFASLCHCNSCISCSNSSIADASFFWGGGPSLLPIWTDGVYPSNSSTQVPSSDIRFFARYTFRTRCVTGWLAWVLYASNKKREYRLRWAPL
jgi:hypothetical protein